jgi:phage major head subunit gpT-like protein
MEINAGNLALLNQAYNAAFSRGLETVKPMWQMVATPVPSTTSEEKYGWLGATTKFREWIGDRQVQNLRQHDYTIKNKTWESTVSVKRERIEDDQYGIYAPLMEQMGQDAALHPDELVYSLLNVGDSTPCYDGQFFFDTDHPVGLPGQEVSVSNFGGGAGTRWYLFDDTKVLKPVLFQKRRDYKITPKTRLDDDNVFERNEFVWGADARTNVGFGFWQTAYMSRQTLDLTSYASARTAMMSFKNDAGKPLVTMPKVLLVPPSLEKAALDVIQAERLANGATNVYRNTARVEVCPWLS